MQGVFRKPEERTDLLRKRCPIARCLHQIRFIRDRQDTPSRQLSFFYISPSFPVLAQPQKTVGRDAEGENNEDVFNLDEVEKNVIQKAIDRNAGNISKAAKELGLTRASLYRRLEKHGL